MKKYIVKTSYDSGLMFEDKETAVAILEATPVRTHGYADKIWTIDDREISLFVIDDSKLAKNDEGGSDAS